MGNLQEEVDLKKTIKISARRFEESPYIERTYSPEMVRGVYACLLYTSPSPRDGLLSRMPSSA